MVQNLDYSTYYNVAKMQYDNVVNAINAFQHGNIENAKSILTNVISNLGALHFFDFMLFSDFKNNELDFETYNVTDDHDDNDVIFIDDNFYLSESYKSMVANDDYYQNTYHFGYGSNSVIYTIFGFCLGKSLINGCN